MEDRAVSLNAVIEQIKNQYNEHNELIPKWLSIGDLPSVKPQKGEWIDISPITWKCNQCGYKVQRWNNTNFCGNCGCWMNGGADEQKSHI